MRTLERRTTKCLSDNSPPQPEEVKVKGERASSSSKTNEKEPQASLAKPANQTSGGNTFRVIITQIKRLIALRLTILNKALFLGQHTTSIYTIIPPQAQILSWRRSLSTDLTRDMKL